MRKIDNNKALNEKAAKTINFDKNVLLALEKKAIIENTTVSRLINFMARHTILSDVAYHAEMVQFHRMESERHKYLREVAETKENI